MELAGCELTPVEIQVQTVVLLQDGAVGGLVQERVMSTFCAGSLTMVLLFLEADCTLSYMDSKQLLEVQETLSSNLSVVANPSHLTSNAPSGPLGNHW